MNLKVISRNVGTALLVSSLFMLLSVFVSLADGGDSALAPLLISFSLTFTVGVFPFIFVRKTDRITLRDGYMIIFLSWFLSFVFGMLPYALWGGPFTLVNAWFESVSGFTTTGSTILEDVEALPRSLLFWRSSTHFIGGLGVVVFLLLIIPNSSPVRLRLTNMELSSLARDDYRSRANKTVFIFAWVYLGICALAFVSYMLAGMSPFDAINHAFSVCATGGFSTRNLSIGHFRSELISSLTIVFMYLASIHFGLIFMTLASRTLRPLNNPVLKFYTLGLIVCSVLSSISLKMEGIDNTWARAFLDGTFHVVSYASTSGLAISDNAHWPVLPCFILIICSLVCGCSGSTTGGLKADRVIVLFRAVRMQIVRVRGQVRPSHPPRRGSVSADPVYRPVLPAHRPVFRPGRPGRGSEPACPAGIAGFAHECGPVARKYRLIRQLQCGAPCAQVHLYPGHVPGPCGNLSGLCGRGQHLPQEVADGPGRFPLRTVPAAFPL